MFCIGFFVQLIFLINFLKCLMILQLPVETGSNLRVEVTGKGTGKMRIDLRYNVEMTDVQKCPFDINVTSKLIKHNKTAIELGKLRYVIKNDMTLKVSI